MVNNDFERRLGFDRPGLDSAAFRFASMIWCDDAFL